MNLDQSPASPIAVDGAASAATADTATQTLTLAPAIRGARDQVAGKAKAGPARDGRPPALRAEAVPSAWTGLTITF